YLFVPDDLIAVPLLLWLAGSILWFLALHDRGALALAFAGTILAMGVHFGMPSWLHISKLAVSDYKGVAYARKFPDTSRVYAQATPFGYLEVYASSYLHFAPGLSDNASLNLATMPANAYLGLY